MYSKKERRIRDALREERDKFIKAKIPASRDEMNDLDQTLMKMFMACKGYEMSISVLPPSYDSDFGGYAVNIIHPRGEVRGSGVHLYDAIYMAQSRLKEMVDTPEIKVIEVSAIPDIPAPKKKISLDDIDI